MNTRIVIFACFLLIAWNPSQAQWLHANGPHNETNAFNEDVSCLAFIGSNLFAGTGSSGLLLSTDSGITWAAVNIGLNASGVNTLLFSGGNFFAGTTGGLFLSTDSGITWNLMPVDTSTTPTITSIAVNGSNIIASSRSGFSSTTYFSTNDGVNWNVADVEMPPEVTCLVVLNGNIYAGSNGGNTILAGVFVSTNNGASWSPTDTGQRSGQRFVFDLAVNGRNLFESTLNGLFLSSDDGASWIPIDSGLPDPSLYSSRVYALAVSGQNIYAGTDGYGIYISSNNGYSWSALHDDGLTNPYISSLLINGENLYAGTGGGGVFHSTDNGANWTVHNQQTLIESHINSLDTIGNMLFACTQAGLYVTTDSGAHWNSDGSGMGDVSVAALVVNGGDMFAGTSGGVFRSTDGGIFWYPCDSGLTVSNVTSLTQSKGTLYAGTNDDLFVSTNNGISWNNPAFANQSVAASTFLAIGTKLIAGSQGGIVNSPDSGKDWYVGDGIPPTPCNALAVIGENIYAGTGGNGVWISTDSGAYWNEANDAGLPDANVTSLLVDRGKLLAGTYGGRVFVSSDSASTWTPIDSGFPRGSEVTSLAFKDSILYAGTTDTGIWRHSISKVDSSPKLLVQTPVQTTSEISIFPNPFTQSTQITFTSPSAGYADVSIVNMLGVEVGRLFSGELGVGEHSFSWDAEGTSAPQGMYECVVRMNGKVETLAVVKF